MLIPQPNLVMSNGKIAGNLALVNNFSMTKKLLTKFEVGHHGQTIHPREKKINEFVQNYWRFSMGMIIFDLLDYAGS
jgi:hypothetical protein